jgi:SagB-type dehydrogenase family enzyme
LDLHFQLRRKLASTLFRVNDARGFVILEGMEAEGGLNNDAARTWAYHNATKHSELSLRTDPHYLDWQNQPIPLKIYPAIDPIPLPRDADQTGIAALSTISAGTVEEKSEIYPSLQDLARILYFSAGIIRKKTFPGGEIFFRAAPCTGALYEFEIYLVCGDLADLKAGVYHFGPGDFALRLLRPGDYRGVLVHAAAGEPSVAHAAVMVVCAGTYWRNAWKYRARTYRHFGWDNGTILANMLAMTAALRVPAKIVLGWVDSEVNRLLGLDTQREVVFSMVSLGYAASETPAATKELEELAFSTIPLSKREVEYPELSKIHEASSLKTADEVAEWRERARASASMSALLEVIVGSRPPSTDTIEQVILRRGSSRRFAREPITLEQLRTILQTSLGPIWPKFALLNEVYLIANAVDGLNPGAYYFHADTAELELLRTGNFRDEARHLGLDQDLPGDAAADVFFLADLHKILAVFGNRGYRATQLEAGILGGRLYLAAYALRLGATGLTFLDDDVTNFFSPHAAGKSAIFLVALGR